MLKISVQSPGSGLGKVLNAHRAFTSKPPSIRFRLPCDPTYHCPMQKATEALIEFRDERDWKQFHDPKNLAAALGIEAAELNEVFLWKTTEASRDVYVDKVKEELADVFAYALLMAEAFNLDPEAIVLEKVKANAVKYPVEKAKGTATKYTDL